MVLKIKSPAVAAILLFALVACSGPKTPADVHWTSYGGDASDNHYSPLDQITDKNIDQLGLAWSYDIDIVPSTYSSPIEVDGVLYFAAAYSVIHALDARTGELLWQYDPKAPEAAGEKMRSAWGIRGISSGHGKIYTGTVDGRLIAIDAKTGQEIWSVQTIEADDGRYISGPPWVFGDKVAIGHGGADFALVRGYVTAYDANTGKQAWRFYTVPGNPAEGFENDAMRMAAETWKGEWWEMGGGGTVWNAMAYDEKYNRLYIGTGNGGPWNQKVRSPGGGDNLFLCSIVALDANTGEYVWHYQVNPGDTWDYNAAMEIALADMEIDGATRSVLLHAPKNGFFYVLDRENGQLISAEPFAKTITWAERIDKQSGRPVEVAAARLPDGKPFAVFPSPIGAHSVETMSFSRQTGFAYIPAIESGRMFADPPDPSKWVFKPGQVSNTGYVEASNRDLPPQTNRLVAWDPRTQKEVWAVEQPGTRAGGLLSTGGNLVFQGDSTGHINAYAADTGKRVWSFDAQNGILAQPISYMLDGRQYVTIIASWRMGSSSGPGMDWDYRSQRRRVLTFALDGDKVLPPADQEVVPFQDNPAFIVDDAKARAGGEIFGLRCARCHGSGAVPGGAGPDLRGSFVPLDLGAMRAVLRDGVLVANGMPKYEELTDSDIVALQNFIRNQQRKQTDGGGEQGAQ